MPNGDKFSWYPVSIWSKIPLSISIDANEYSQFAGFAVKKVT